MKFTIIIKENDNRFFDPYSVTVVNEDPSIRCDIRRTFSGISLAACLKRVNRWIMEQRDEILLHKTHGKMEKL